MRERFLTALAKNEDDETTRLVYADWLDEQGEYDEATRQRKWTGAKKWLVEFFKEHRVHMDRLCDLSMYRDEVVENLEIVDGIKLIKMP